MRIKPRTVKKQFQGFASAQRGGWTLIVLLISVAIIAILMGIYLPSVLETKGKDGQKKPVIQSVKEQLAPIDQRNQEINQTIEEPAQPEESQDTRYKKEDIQYDEYEYAG